jgi:hypothetical protein
MFGPSDRIYVADMLLIPLTELVPVVSYAQGQMGNPGLYIPLLASALKNQKSNHDCTHQKSPFWG